MERPPRPGSITDAEGASYPSEHGAYATAWIAVALALRHALSHRAALLAIGILLATGIAQARVYLQADWFSDVAGGLGLGALSRPDRQRRPPGRPRPSPGHGRPRPCPLSRSSGNDHDRQDPPCVRSLGTATGTVKIIPRPDSNRRPRTSLVVF
ncbi:MAG: phosphatase PAP2 family protein [Gaiellaceae bacterium]